MTRLRPVDSEPLLIPYEATRLLGVNPKTLTRWADAGKITLIRTPGGQRRYREAEIRALLRQRAA